MQRIPRWRLFPCRIRSPKDAKPDPDKAALKAGLVEILEDDEDGIAATMQDFGLLTLLCGGFAPARSLKSRFPQRGGFLFGVRFRPSPPVLTACAARSWDDGKPSCLTVSLTISAIPENSVTLPALSGQNRVTVGICFQRRSMTHENENALSPVPPFIQLESRQV
jgi:hypothetical protein